MADWYDAYDLYKDMCANCGKDCGSHNAINAQCRDPKGGYDPNSTFTLATATTYINPAAKPGNWYYNIHFDDLCANCGIRCGNHSMFDAACPAGGAYSATSRWAVKGSAAKQPDPFIEAPKPSAAKTLSPECPCGIN